MAHRYVLGKVDYLENGRANCEAALTWSVENGRFSMCGEIWQPSKRDTLTGGQCIEEVVKLFPNDAKAQRMAEVWRRWHLNDMRAGSPAQEAWLRANPVTAVYPNSHFSVASNALKEAGLNPDPNYEYNGKPYVYGSAWLKEELPAEIVAEIDSWSA